jgi:hypothetical protein
MGQGDISHLVGDLSPKGRVGGSRLASVFGRKSIGNTHCHPNTGLLSAIADAMFRRNIAYHWVDDHSITIRPGTENFQGRCGK